MKATTRFLAGAAAVMLAAMGATTLMAAAPLAPLGIPPTTIPSVTPPSTPPANAPGAFARARAPVELGPVAFIPREVKQQNPTRVPNPAATYTRTAVRNDARHGAFVEIAKQGDVDILFQGDSITDWWQQAGQGGQAAMAKHFQGVKVANFAIAGDTTQGVLWGLKNGEGEGPDLKMKPKAIMLMIGTNNTGSCTAGEIAEGIGAIVAENRRIFPDAKILLLAIFPRGNGPLDKNRQKINEVNAIIAKLADEKHVFFMDLGPKLMDADGALIGFRPDNLHPSPVGYDIWGEAVAEKLKSWLK